MKTACLIILILALSHQVLSFKAETHLIIARIAYDLLQSGHPTALQQAQTLLKIYSSAQPSQIPKEAGYPFVECATLADDIKRTGGGYQSDWHFINLPYLDEGGKITDFGKYGQTDHNITQAIPQIMDWLRNINGHQYEYVYTTMIKKFATEDQAKSFALRLLIHYLGDVHQPLHCATKVDKENPNGDLGGNTFPLPNHYYVDNLHSLWDAVLYEFRDSIKLPFDSPTWDKIGTAAHGLVQKYSLQSSEYMNNDYAKWAQVNFQIAEDNTYQGITANQTVPQPYIDKAIPILERQIVLGGYRLAYLITQIFGNSETSEESEIQEVQQDQKVDFLQ